MTFTATHHDPEALATIDRIAMREAVLSNHPIFGAKHNARTTDAQHMSKDDINKFYDGAWLSEYALACGYKESYEQGKGVRFDTAESLTLWGSTNENFHVRHHHYDEGRRFWDSFETLDEARLRFTTALREMISS